MDRNEIESILLLGKMVGPAQMINGCDEISHLTTPDYL